MPMDKQIKWRNAQAKRRATRNKKKKEGESTTTKMWIMVKKKKKKCNEKCMCVYAASTLPKGKYY